MLEKHSPHRHVCRSAIPTKETGLRHLPVRAPGRVRRPRGPRAGTVIATILLAAELDMRDDPIPGDCRVAPWPGVLTRDEAAVKIAFFGAGNMGTPMALNLLRAGHEVR